MDHPKVSNLMKGETSPNLNLFVISSRFFEPQTMASSSTLSDVTTAYSYGDAGEEYVFTYQDHPFAVLDSKILPTWEDSLIDYDFVRKVGLKLTDIQCMRVTFGGHILRIMGRVRATVQCVKNGRSLGEFKIDARAATDILRRFDTYMVAGRKMKRKLATHRVDTSGEEEPTSTPSRVPPVLYNCANPPRHKRQSKPISKLYTLDHQDWDAVCHWSEEAEYDGGIILQSLKDRKPRVTNVNLAVKGMIKVGNWDNLKDPEVLEACHIALAKIRKTHPERICQTCDYLLAHNCPEVNDSDSSEKHCEECCVSRQLEDPLGFCENNMCGLPRLGHVCEDPFHVYTDCDCEDPTHGDRHCQDCCPYTC